jgi:RimJ/RimL family protein N-acetyltransferase
VFPDEIATERLQLVRLCRENVSPATLYRHMRAGAPHMGEVSEYVMWDPHETLKDTHDYLRDVERQWDDREQATYAIRPTEGASERGVDSERESHDEEARVEGSRIEESRAEGVSVDGSLETRTRTDDGGLVQRVPDVTDEMDADAGTDGTPDSDRLAGTTNLHFDWGRRTAELGIWLRKPFWGRGYSGERAAALLELAFERLDLELVGASHQDGNEQSRRAIEKYVERFGGQYDGLLRNFVPRGDEVRDLHRYTISQEQYREATGGGGDSGT